jgi:hypothetical protein
MCNVLKIDNDQQTYQKSNSADAKKRRSKNQTCVTRTKKLDQRGPGRDEERRNKQVSTTKK